MFQFRDSSLTIAIETIVREISVDTLTILAVNQNWRGGMRAFVDVSGRSALLLEGPDSLDFIQRISTNDVSQLRVGKHIQSVLTNEKGRIIDVVTVCRIGETQTLLLGQSTENQSLVSWVSRYIIMEDIVVRDLTSLTAQFILYGDDVLDHSISRPDLGNDFLILTESLAGVTYLRATSNPLSKSATAHTLESAGFSKSTVKEFTEYRIRAGIPVAGSELTVQYNPLEANLSALISWTKGCYIGQEVIARLDTYKKVQKRLVKVSLADLPPEVPFPFYVREAEAGVITSAIRLSGTDKCLGLAYRRVSEAIGENEGCFVKNGLKVHLSINDDETK